MYLVFGQTAKATWDKPHVDILTHVPQHGDWIVLLYDSSIPISAYARIGLEQATNAVGHVSSRCVGAIDLVYTLEDSPLRQFGNVPVYLHVRNGTIVKQHRGDMVYDRLKEFIRD